MYDSEGARIDPKAAEKEAKKEQYKNVKLSGKSIAIGILAGTLVWLGLVFTLVEIFTVHNHALNDGVDGSGAFLIGFGLPYVVFPFLCYRMGRKVAVRAELAMTPGSNASALGSTAIAVVSVVGVCAVVAVILMAVAIYAAVIAFIFFFALLLALLAL